MPVRFRKLFACWLVGAAFPCAQSARAQPVPDRSAQKVLRAANDLIAAQQWELATKALQSLLNDPKDSKVEVARPGLDGKPMTSLVSAWSEAERAIQRLPAEGLAFYQKQYGPEAAQLLKEAKGLHAEDRWAEAARRFRFTPGGIDATELLAASLLAAGKSKESLPHFARLIEWPGSAKLPPLTLFQAALAYRAAGDRPRSDALWQELSPRIGKEGLRVNDRTLSREELHQEIEKRSP